MLLSREQYEPRGGQVRAHIDHPLLNRSCERVVPTPAPVRTPTRGFAGTLADNCGKHNLLRRFPALDPYLRD